MKMRLELSHIRLPETEIARVFDPADLPGEGEEYRVSTPVDLRLTIHKDHDRFRLVGTVKAVLGLECSRCLEPFVLPVDRAFDLRFLPATAVETEKDEDEEAEVEEDDVSITYYRDEQIDLIELLREQFYLALPMKPLCSPACKGICPQCGTNRNLAPCDCSPQVADPRLAGLKTLTTKRKHDDA
jgi:uncharacterized protein